MSYVSDTSPAKVISKSISDLLEGAMLDIRVEPFISHGNHELKIAISGLHSLGVTPIRNSDPIPVVKSFIENFRNCPLFKEMMDKKQEEIDLLEARVSKLNKDLTRLERYKTYYELAKGMKHNETEEQYGDGNKS